MSTTVDDGSPARIAADAPTVTVAGLHTADDSGLPPVGMAAPSLSWRLESDRAGARQTAYEVQVAADPGFAAEVAGSGEVECSRPLHAAWPAAPLRSREVRWWPGRARRDRGRVWRSGAAPGEAGPPRRPATRGRPVP